MASRAQLSQERSRVRRDALLDAAIELFVEGGSRAVTHRAVATAAGLPAATTTYYFETIEDLLREALRRHLYRWLTVMDQYGGTDPAAMLPLLTQDSSALIIKSIFDERPPSFAARELAVVLGAARDPHLRDQATEALRTAIALMEGVMERIGLPAHSGLADDLMAIIGGISVRRASGVYTDAEEAVHVVRLVQRLVAGYLLDDETLGALMCGVRDKALAQPDVSGRSAESP